jgi:RNA polymerase sigma-70 factor (ECF subfamily)
VTSDTDSALLSAFVRTHDPVAFDQIARRYRGMVFSVARRVTQSYHDAEDVAQNCFFELSRRAGSIRIPLAAFLHQTATRRSIDLLRDQTRRRRYEQRAASDRPENIVDDPADRCWDEISPEVDRAIDQLPDELKNLVILYFLRGLSVADIALETGMNRGRIERRLNIGVRRLRALLAKENRVISVGVLAAGLRASTLHAVPATLTASTGRMALAAGMHRRAPVPRPVVRAGWSFQMAGSLVGLALLTIGFGLVLINASANHRRRLLGSAAPISAYDRLASAYAGVLPNESVSGFFRHSAAIKNDPTSFWRGTQPLFFQWCRTNCPDWFAESASYLRCHASPNLEDAQRFAIFVNCESSASLPIQIELLQGLIVSRLATDRDLTSDSNVSAARVAAALCQSYRSSLLADDPLPVLGYDSAALLDTRKYVDQSGRLKSIVLNSRGKQLELLRPSPIDSTEVNRMIESAISRSAPLRDVCGDHPRVQEVRACVRHNAVVTQGQLVLLAQLWGSGRMLEIKQQTPSPAELAHAVSNDPRAPAQRAAEDAAVLSPSGSAPIGWCEWNGQSFTIAPLDLHPPVYELRKERWTDPVKAAQCWAAATAATHRRNPARTLLAAAITPQLEAELVQRSDAYLKAMQADLQSFLADPRVATDRTTEDSLATAWLDEARHSN